MLFNQIAFLTCSTERIGSSMVRKQIILDLRELAGNGLEQDIAMGGLSQRECNRNILYERIKSNHQKARGTQNGKGHS